MGTNMSNPRRGGLTDPPGKGSPTKEENSQNLSNSPSTKLINPEESTRLSDRPVEHSEPPTRSSYCDPSQVNLLISLLKEEAPFIDLTNLSFAGRYPPNTLIDRAKRNRDLVLSFLLPQDFPSSPAKLVHWTREILREGFPLGITSILSFTQAKDIFNLIQATHTHSTPNQQSLWKENSVVFFDCEASWKPDPSRVHCVVYKIHHNTHQIAVLRVDEAAEEYKQHFDTDRVKFAKAIIIPLLISLRILSFKFAETEPGDMENRDAAWWLPIVAERVRRSREQNTDPSPEYQTHRTPFDDFRVFGNTSQSWLGGYEASTFQPLSHPPHHQDSPNPPNTASSTVNSAAADSSSTPHSHEKAGSARASRKAAKKKEKKKARKEAKKAEIEASDLQGVYSTVPIESAKEHHSPNQRNNTKDLTRIDGGESPLNSPQLIVDDKTNEAQKQASIVPDEQIDEHPSLSHDNTEHSVSLGNSAIRDLKPAKESSPAPEPSAEVLFTTDDSLVTSPTIISCDTTTIPGDEIPSKFSSDPPQNSSPTKQDSIPSNVSSVRAESPTVLTANALLEITTASAGEKTAQSSNKRKNKGKKKGSRKLKGADKMTVDNTQKPNSTPIGPGLEENLSENSTPVISASSDALPQEKQTLTEQPVGEYSTPLDNSSGTKHAPIESTPSLYISLRSKQKTVSDEQALNLVTKPSENQMSTSARDLSESQSTSCGKISKIKSANSSTNKAPVPLRPSLKESSQAKPAPSITSSSSSDSVPKSSSNLGPTPDVKSSDSESKVLTANNATNPHSSIKDSISEDYQINGESKRKASPEEQPQSSSRGLSSKDQVKGDPNAGELAKKGENKKSSKSKKKNKRSRKARNKNDESTIPDTDTANKTEVANSDASTSLNDNAQSSSSDTMNGNKSSSSLSKASLDDKLTTASSEVPSSNKSKSKPSHDHKVPTSSGTAYHAPDQKATHSQSEAPSVSQVKGDGSTRRPPIPLMMSERRTSVNPLGMGNQLPTRAPGKSAEEIKRPSRPEPVPKAPSVETADKTKGSGTAETRNTQSLPKNPRREVPVAGPASETRSTRTSTNAPSSNPRTQGRQASQGFFWQLDSHGFPCAMAGCDKRCNSWDGASVICPKCGPYSEIRYCGKEHLFEDVKFHWLQCGTKTFKHPCRASTIPREQKEGPPLLPNLHNWDTPERFRQAVRHAADNSGDYFVFGDWQDWMAAGQPANNVAVRCSTRVIYTARFDDPVERDQFRRVQGIALFNPLQFELVGYLFRLIRGNALAKGQWSEELDLALQYQFNLEYGFAVGPWLGDRHACETEWTGANIRHCSDAVCRAERAPLLGDRGVGRGFQHLCEYMEASHWLLRAARRTHPSVAAVEERMRGEGFEGVVPGDRRVFRRGESWDGFGTGEMEIEGVNLF